jgi:branched-chain amino acid transport system permease protein
MADPVATPPERRALLIAGALLAVFLALPLIAGDYLLTVLILIFYFAYVGQAWNIMMGFTGQLSIGHALFVGLAGYFTAYLFKQHGIGPWIGLLGAIPVTMAVGAAIGFLAFRFRVSGVYFAILTIAFSEFARIGFDHLTIVNGSGGFFLPVARVEHSDPWLLRGAPSMFYYVMLGATVAALILCRALLNSRIGYYWRAIREDEAAALAAGIDTFRYKLAAVAISAGMTAFAGVFYAFYYNNLFPEQVFSISRSIELLVGPIIGGLGTLLGPIVGAFLLTTLAEGLTAILGALGIDIPGAKQVLYGACLLFIIMVLPGGVWPWIAKKLRALGGAR